MVDGALWALQPQFIKCRVWRVRLVSLLSPWVRIQNEGLHFGSFHDQKN